MFIPLTEAQKKKVKKGFCKNQFCRKKKVKNGNECACCKKRKFRENNPVKNCFYNLRTNAKRRGKEFTLTFQQFEKFVSKNNYMEMRGKTALSLSIDRVKNHLGYTEKNIRAITLQDNSFKRNYVDYNANAPCPF